LANNQQTTNKKQTKIKQKTSPSKQITTTNLRLQHGKHLGWGNQGKEYVMRTAKPNGSAEIKRSLEKDIAGNIRELARVNTAFRQVENGNDEPSSSDLGTLLRQVAEASTHEVEVLIDDLHGLRKKLQSDGDRIQSDIGRYAELSQGVVQLAAIISDSVKKIPGAPSISP
jgi:hypothetical protein